MTARLSGFVPMRYRGGQADTMPVDGQPARTARGYHPPR